MDTEYKIQYILDENKKLIEMNKLDAKPVDNPIKIKRKNAFEVFVLVKGTENYWISNYGRCVNNLNHKDKNIFYHHKQGNVHHTVFEIERFPEKKKGKPTGKELVTRYKRNTSPSKLVASAFLVSYKERFKIWHKDNDLENNWYKNLIYVSETDYRNLKSGKINLGDLNLEQEYIEYINKADYSAYTIYNGIRQRCGDITNKDNIHDCYEDATMCKEWMDNPKSFVKWYLEHYYEVDGESMAVDKDLFGQDSKVYSPETCCILPQGLNTMLTNLKKRNMKKEHKKDVLPICVHYSFGKYHSEILLSNIGKILRLSDWNTKEEAFAEYKKYKEADKLITIAKYKDKIPTYIYLELLKVEVKPY